MNQNKHKLTRDCNCDSCGKERQRLSVWLRQQWILYRDNRLPPDRRAMLESLDDFAGFCEHMKKEDAEDAELLEAFKQAQTPDDIM